MRGNNNYSCAAEKGFMLPSIDAKHSTDKQIKSLYIQPSDSRSFREGRLPQQKHRAVTFSFGGQLRLPLSR